MSRVISYDHRPAPYLNRREEITLSPQVLQQYEGEYHGPQTRIVMVTKGQNGLILTIGDKRNSIFPESERIFFSKERDLTFEFLRDDANRVSTIVVRERGEVVERLNRVK